MWSEKRSLENTLFFDFFAIFACIIGNISFYIYKLGINPSLNIDINIDTTNSMAILPIIFTLIVAAMNFNIHIKPEKLYEFNKTMLKYKLINIPFIIYILFTLLIVRDSSVFISSLLMEIAYICIYLIKRKANSYYLTDIQLRWRKAYDYPNASDEESNIFWRFKPMFYPHVYVSFTKRFQKLNLISIIFFIFLTYDTSSIFLISIFFLIFLKDILYILDILLGSYTKTTGLCTGIVEKSKDDGRIYFTVYITDYENKREIIFKVNSYCFISERDMVTVVHSSLAKKVIEVEGMRMDIF